MDDRNPLPPRADFIRYLRDFVLPQLREAGAKRVVNDFEMVVRYLEDEDRDGPQPSRTPVN